MRGILLLCLLLTGSVTGFGQYFDTLHIHYPIGSEQLPAAEKGKLDSLAKHNGNRTILIYSYADYLGSEKPNQHLSDQRAATVKAFLLRAGVSAEQIRESTGLGQVPGSGGSDGDPNSRRTDVFIRREAEMIKPAAPSTPSATKQKNAQQSKPVPQGIPVPNDAPATAAGPVTPIDMQTLQVNEVIVLKNIQFHLGTADMLLSSLPELDHLYQIMAANPGLKIRLEGHVCCCVYPDGYLEDTPTWQLSVQRAFVVYRYLIKKGIDPQRLQFKGLGRTHPIRDNEQTAEEGQVNRRVEARILEK